MGKASRDKGKSGEREIAAIVRDLTGWDVRRRVRQHDGDSDLEGIPGWSVEVKRHATASRADIKAWWSQAVAQAWDEAGTVRPVLFFRRDRDEWRAVWGVAPESWTYANTCEGSIEAWAMVAREAMS